MGCSSGNQKQVPFGRFLYIVHEIKNYIDVYLKEKEPTKYYKSYAWKTAIGLQMVDGLETSEYLIKTAHKNINGEINFDEVHKLLDSYYKENSNQSERVEEADKVSARIAKKKYNKFHQIQFLHHT